MIETFDEVCEVACVKFGGFWRLSAIFKFKQKNFFWRLVPKSNVSALPLINKYFQISWCAKQLFWNIWVKQGYWYIFFFYVFLLFLIQLSFYLSFLKFQWASLLMDIVILVYLILEGFYNKYLWLQSAKLVVLNLYFLWNKPRGWTNLKIRGKILPGWQSN